jgi:hypothetical protein
MMESMWNNPFFQKLIRMKREKRSFNMEAETSKGRFGFDQ